MNDAMSLMLLISVAKQQNRIKKGDRIHVWSTWNLESCSLFTIESHSEIFLLEDIDLIVEAVEMEFL